MLTPRFDLSQTDNEVTVNVHAPYANIKDTEVFVEENDFRFFSSPYYLRLQLPGKIVENDASSGSYDCDKGLFTLKFSKVNKGEHFDNLDMITTLLAPPQEKKNIGPSIEVIGNPAAEHTDGIDPVLNNEKDELENGDEWYTHQVPTPSVINILQNAPKYGFANKTSGALLTFEAGFLKDVVDLPSPDSTPMDQRKVLRDADEREHFDEGHYLADLVQADETVQPSIDFEPAWYNFTNTDVELTDKEKDILKELPNKEFLLDEGDIQVALFSMVDILFCSCYNNRATYGENTSESSWNINKISATLSWFQSFTSIKDVIHTCVRRSLIFPLYRHWDLSTKVLEDVRKIVNLGKKMIVKQFCEVYELFNNSFEPRYILNQLYIRDYLIWLQKVPDTLIVAVAKCLEDINPKREDMGLELVELEAAAWSVLEEENAETEHIDSLLDSESNLVIQNSIHDITSGIDKIALRNIAEKSPTTSDEEDSSESDSDSDSDTTSTSSCSSCSSTSSSSTCNSEITDEDQLIMQIKKIAEQLDSDDLSDTD